MLDLTCVVHLKNVISTKLDVVWQLTVLKEVHHECHLANWSACTPNNYTLSHYMYTQLDTKPQVLCSLAVPIRGPAAPQMYFLHLSLSSVILTDCSTGSPIHVLMLSIQAMRGLHGLRVTGIVPCLISFSKQLPCFLMVWPQYASFLASTVSNSSLFTPALLRSHSFVFFYVHETRRIFLNPFRRQDVYPQVMTTSENRQDV